MYYIRLSLIAHARVGTSDNGLKSPNLRGHESHSFRDLIAGIRVRNFGHLWAHLLP